MHVALVRESVLAKYHGHLGDSDAYSRRTYSNVVGRAKSATVRFGCEQPGSTSFRSIGLPIKLSPLSLQLSKDLKCSAASAVRLSSIFNAVCECCQTGLNLPSRLRVPSSSLPSASAVRLNTVFVDVHECCWTELHLHCCLRVLLDCGLHLD